MIEAVQLTKFYDRNPALTEVSFEVNKGEILGFLGPNGAGKTTTMRILTGFIPPSSGTAKVAGFDILTHSMEVRKRIGYMPENPPLYNEMTVSSFLKFISRLKRVPKSKEKQRIDYVIQKCNLEAVDKRLIGHLSRGFRQRVGLAQALIQDPQVLILDEPTIGLDPAQIIEIRELIRGLAGEHTVILSSHILPEVEQTCERVVIINKGKVIAVDTPENLSISLRGANVYHLTVRRPAEELKNKLQTIPGVKIVREEENGVYILEAEKNQDIREDIVELVVQQKAGLLEFKSVAFTLEDVFVHLTTAEQISPGETAT
jgi:ABC-2 type transport system ATP-binding protein